MLILISCNIVTLRYTNFTTKGLCFFLPVIVSSRYIITVDCVSVIDCNSISFKCTGVKHLYSSVSTTFYSAKGHV